MKKILLIVVIAMLLASCNQNVIENIEPDTEIADVIKDETPPFVREQSQIPFLGLEDVKHLFAGRYTIADWIRDIEIDDINFLFFIEGATGITRLDILPAVFGNGYIASFYIEDNPFADFRSNYNTDQWLYQTLPDEILVLNVVEVLHLSFASMGIPFNIRGITHRSNEVDVRLAFLNARKDNYGLFGTLYEISDVVPDAVVDYDSGVPFIGGVFSQRVGNSITHTFRYYHTIPYGDTFTIYCVRTRIVIRVNYPIGFTEPITTLVFTDITHRN